MINDIHFPEQLSGEELDEYLVKGWYRMGQTIFSTDHIEYDDQLYAVYWLRYNIRQLTCSKSQQKLITLNQEFSFSILPFYMTEEVEMLYSSYRASVAFDAPESVSQFLFDGSYSDIFDTHIIEIRDKGLLIAAGIFDKGKESIAGIMNFYHPAYKKYSLGKYLMLLKIGHAKELGKIWYYPGYIVPGNPRFDYKLFIDKMKAEIYLPGNDCWEKYELIRINGR